MATWTDNRTATTDRRATPRGGRRYADVIRAIRAATSSAPRTNGDLVKGLK